MKTIVALIGKAGSGKDRILNELCRANPTYHKIINCTTRPMRENETDGKDYHFLSMTDFITKIVNGDMLEATEFNGWGYGTMKSSLTDGVNIGVFNPESYDHLTILPLEDVQVYGFYVDCNAKERLIRQLNREQEPDVGEIIRRYSADEIDFTELDEEKVSGVKHLYNETEKDLEVVCDIIVATISGQK